MCFFLFLRGTAEDSEGDDAAEHLFESFIINIGSSDDDDDDDDDEEKENEI